MIKYSLNVDTEDARRIFDGTFKRAHACRVCKHSGARMGIFARAIVVNASIKQDAYIPSSLITRMPHRSPSPPGAEGCRLGVLPRV